MDVSQPTFYRILASARKKIADAIVHGKSIAIPALPNGTNIKQENFP